MDGLHGLLDGLRDGLGLDRVVYGLGVQGLEGLGFRLASLASAVPRQSAARRCWKPACQAGLCIYTGYRV